MSDPTFSELVSFTRSSVAWRTNADGLSEEVAVDVPRFDYDATTKAPRGLLLESAGANPDGSARAADNAAVILTPDWFNPAQGVWLVDFEHPGPGTHTVLELTSPAAQFGIRVVDGTAYAYYGDSTFAFDTAIARQITQMVIAYGQDGVRAARNGVVTQLSQARVQRVAEVRLGETAAAAVHLDSRVVSFRYIGQGASAAEVAAYATSDEWADIVDYVTQTYGDGFVPLCDELNEAINTTTEGE